MKSILSALLLTLATSQSFATTFVCNELNGRNPHKLQVVITELENITKRVSYGVHFDSVLLVQVELSEIFNGRKLKTKKFEAIAKTEDVLYNVTSVRENGFKFGMYMDEDDQNWIELTSSNGTKRKAHFRCELK